jgi:hypothetical protein
MIERERRG